MVNNGRYIQNPVSIDLKRSRFNRDFGHKTTFNVGELVPFFVDEVLPGDTFDIKTSFVARLSTLKVPVMDNLFIDFAYFFVPNRIVMDKWQEVMGENRVSMWKPSVETFVPTVTYKTKDDDPDEYAEGLGSIGDYMGLSFHGVTDATNVPEDYEINVLPFRAYVTIYNEFYRSENVQDPIFCPTDATNRQIEAGTSLFNPTNAHLGWSPLLIANKIPDYFTSALPEPQKGPSVVIPVGLVAPVKTQLNIHSGSATWPGLMWNKASSLPAHKIILASTLVGGDPESTTTRIGNTNTLDPSIGEVAPANLVADLSQATATSINELRNAFQLQRLYEKDARGGTRYVEIIKSHFGVTAPDAHLQRPQFLGGSRKPIQISQVLATAQNDTDDTALADTGAYSLTGGLPASFTKSFTEHGFVIGVCVVRYEHTYAKGLERFWFRKRRFDYYDPVFANIGEQPVMKREIDYRAGNTDVFGYQEAWADYRYKPNRVSAEMKAAVSSGSLNFWHFADEYDTVPTLSESWLAEDKNNVDRALAVTSKLSRQIIADIYVQNRCTRVMPLYSIPGLIDHN
nr:MAG: major capsid protein [Microvirus sp.]